MPKMTHEQANYHVASSKKRRCGTCAMYRHIDSTCSLVASPIKPEDVCRYYRPGKGMKEGG